MQHIFALLVFRTYSPITESDKRPLGFSVGQYIYNSDRGTCVTVQGTAGRRIEVQVQICLKDSLNLVV